MATLGGVVASGRLGACSEGVPNLMGEMTKVLGLFGLAGLATGWRSMESLELALGVLWTASSLRA